MSSKSAVPRSPVSIPQARHRRTPEPRLGDGNNTLASERQPFGETARRSWAPFPVDERSQEHRVRRASILGHHVGNLSVTVQGSGQATLQRTLRHVQTYGPLTNQAINSNFEKHMSRHVANAKSESEVLGARYLSVIEIDEKAIAEEIAAELYTWPGNWNAYNNLNVTTNGAYRYVTYYDGELVDSGTRKFSFRCQLVNTNNGSYYEAYHLNYIVGQQLR